MILAAMAYIMQQKLRAGKVLIKLWKKMEEKGRKWKNIYTFVSISVKSNYGKIYRRI